MVLEIKFNISCFGYTLKKKKIIIMTPNLMKLNRVESFCLLIMSQNFQFSSNLYNFVVYMLCLLQLDWGVHVDLLLYIYIYIYIKSFIYNAYVFIFMGDILSRSRSYILWLWTSLVVSKYLLTCFTEKTSSVYMHIFQQIFDCNSCVRCLHIPISAVIAFADWVLGLGHSKL